MDPSVTCAFSDACTQVCDKNCSRLCAVNCPLWGWVANISDGFSWDIKLISSYSSYWLTSSLWMSLCGVSKQLGKRIFIILWFAPFKDILLLNGWFESNLFPKFGELNYGVTSSSLSPGPLWFIAPFPPCFNPTELHLQFLNLEITPGSVKLPWSWLSLQRWTGCLEHITTIKCDKLHILMDW